MKKYTAFINHDETTVNAFTRTQFNAFHARKRNILLVLAVLFIGVGGMELMGKTVSILCVLIGCLLLVNTGNIPRRTAKAILSAGGQDRRVEYEFDDSGIHVTDGGRKADVKYSTIIRLIADREFFYLFSAPNLVYMLEKSSLEPAEPDEFKAEIAAKCGLRWTAARSAMTENVFSLISRFRK